MRLRSEFGILLLVSFLVSFANEISHGRYLGPALAIIVVAFGVLVGCFVAELLAPATVVWRPRLLLGLILVGLATMQVTALLDPKLIAYPHGSLGVLRGIEVATILLLTTYLPSLVRPEREPTAVRHTRFALFGAMALAAGLATIRISPAPEIDVWHVQMRAGEAFLRGENPYVTVGVPVTCPEWEAQGVKVVPYVYSPGALLVDAFGLLVGKDVRYAMLFAVVIGGIALRAIARGSRRGAATSLPALVEDAPSLFLWLMPSLVFVLEMSWIDPIQLLFICVAVFAHLSGRSIVSAAAIGFALASKQSMFWLVPLAGFVLRFRIREWTAMAATWAIVVVPFIVRDYDALKYATVDHMLALPPRSDALCVAVWLKQTLGWSLPGSVASVAALAVVCASIVGTRGLAARGNDARGERAALFARAVATAYFAFFLFNKWAFANYYFLIAGLAALAGATSLRALQETSNVADARSPPTARASL